MLCNFPSFATKPIPSNGSPLCLFSASFLHDLACIRPIYTLSFATSSFPPPRLLHVGVMPDIDSAFHEHTTTDHTVYIVASFISFLAPHFHPPTFITFHQHQFPFRLPQTYSNIFSSLMASPHFSLILYLSSISHDPYPPKHAIRPVYILYPVLMCTFPPWSLGVTIAIFHVVSVV